MTTPSAEAMEKARTALRRGTPVGEHIRSCACFSDTAPPRASRCHGVCEDAAEYVAAALDAFAAEAVARERERWMTYLSQNGWHTAADEIDRVHSAEIRRARGQS